MSSSKRKHPPKTVNTTSRQGKPAGPLPPRGGGVRALRRPEAARAAAALETAPRHGVARVLSKAGLCSRTEAARWVQAGRVSVDGRIVRDPEFPVRHGPSRVCFDGQPLGRREHVYVLLNKPRGLLTTTVDERGRDTVYRCFDGAGLPWLAPVGRLDKASEGLLLFSSDPQWAAAITSHVGGVTKTYHVQVDALLGPGQIAAIAGGVEDDGQWLTAGSVRLLRQGQCSSWLEVILEEGRNRHIRRLMLANGLQVLRLVRVAIGSVALGELGKGQWRFLEAAEVAGLGRA